MKNPCLFFFFFSLLLFSYSVNAATESYPETVSRRSSGEEYKAKRSDIGYFEKEKLPINPSESNYNKADPKNKVKRNSHPGRITERRTVFLTILLVFFAIIFPPLAVLLVDGLRPPFWLSILLTLLFYVPGLIYALFRIFRT